MADDIDDLLDELEREVAPSSKPTPLPKQSSSAPAPASSSQLFSRSSSSSSVQPVSSSSSSSKAKIISSSKDDENIDDLLNSLDDPTPLPPSSSSLSRASASIASIRQSSASISASSSSSSSSSFSNKRCTAPCVGGTDVPEGPSSALDRRRCNSLRCTKCDFRVLCLDDWIWTKSVDYLFLRNNMPDAEKLKKNLTKKKGSSAYACQCSWKSAKDLESINSSETKWVCGGHSN